MVNDKFIFLFVLFLINIASTRKINDLEKKQFEDKKSTTNSIATGTCHGFKCTPGRVCNIDRKTRKPVCVCIQDCAAVIDPRRKVCSNFNQTWATDCHLYRHRCVCEDGLDENCLEEHKHMHIDYYGECTDSLRCEETVLIDFPRRMREWLYNILTSEHFVIPKNKSDGHDIAHKWVDAVIWQFCDLDKEPEDRVVSRHELFPLRAPLLSMEPCIAEFLDKCDSNADNKITLFEWGSCLGAEQGEIEDKCTIFKSLIHRENRLVTP